MKNYCGVHLQLHNKIEGGKLHGVIMLNPESQIKILENNLNFLNKQNSSFKNVKIKNESFSLSPSSEGTFQSQDTLLHDTSESLKVVTFPNVIHNKHSDVEAVSCNLPCKQSSNNQSDKLKIPLISTSPLVKTKDNETTAMKNNTSAYIRSHNNVGLAKSSKLHTSVEINKSKEGDNQFEFTLEQENIVSFVCSPSPPRKQMGSCCIDDRADSDLESDNSVRYWSSVDKGSSTPCKNITATKHSLKETYLCGQSAKCTRLLWHPPTLGKFGPSSQDTNLNFNCCPLSNGCADSLENALTFGNCANTTGFLNNKKRLKSSISQESVLFREASLRGCNNIENIIRDTKPAQNNVQQKIIKVRESIYSAIRTEKSNDDIVPDGVIAILDICKSWINLNAHFEREDFKDLIESYGIDSSILSDFLHWQCVSRTFIDKMIEALRRITYSKKTRNGSNSQSWNINKNHNASTQGPNANKRYMNVPIVDGFNGYYFREPGGYCNLSKNELSNSKHWKQRRFLLDQQKASAPEKSKRLYKSKVATHNYMNNTQNPVIGTPQFKHGQVDNIHLYYGRDHSLGKTNNFGSTGTSLSPSSSIGLNAMPQGVFTSEYFKNGNCSKPGQKGLSEMCIMQREQNLNYIRPMNELGCCSTPPIVEIPSAHNSFPIQSIPAISQYYNSPICYINPGQAQKNLSQPLISQNPILCVDADITDNCMKTSYMKPGNYNPPQKPINCLRFPNNTIPVKEEEVTGFSFLYASDSQSILQEMKHLHTVNTSLKHVFSEELSVDKSDESWKDAVSLAKSVRESLISTKIESPNLKLSETVSFKSHFLLSDDTSQHSSSNDYKNESECEELNAADNSTRNALEILEVESRLKTTDWLIKSFKESISESDQDLCKDVDALDCISNGVVDEASNGPTNEGLRIHDTNYESSTNNLTLKNNNVNNYDSEKNLNCSNHTDFPQKKLKKGKRIRSDYLTYFEHPATTLQRKPKSVFKRTVTKQISCKLEDILNCIWKFEVSNLITDDLKSEQERTRIELNVRSPLYLQAMKCKLSNHSYDTLEQALADFQQYFFDVRSRNKGDKQSIEAVTALEQLFFDLVEKNFGQTKQHSSQFVGPVGLKMRRQKKAIRRC